jgi:hypothetical protein
MSSDLTTQQLVDQLRRVGLRPSPRTTEAILQRDDAKAALLDLALDTASLNDPEPGALGPIHALRLLGELPAGDSAGAILGRLPLPFPADEPPTQAAYLWAQEAPQIIARWGDAALPEVLAIADADDSLPVRRGAAYATLSYLATATPDLREQVITELRDRLARESDATARGYAVAGLAQLGAREAYTEIMAAYRDKTVDREVMTAADARQLLLGAQKGTQLACALHTLDERYEQHGPYSEEQRRAMAEMAQQRGR